MPHTLKELREKFISGEEARHLRGSPITDKAIADFWITEFTRIITEAMEEIDSRKKGTLEVNSLGGLQQNNDSLRFNLGLIDAKEILSKLIK